MKKLQDSNFKDTSVICRVGFNVDIVEGKILDDTRIKSSLPTIRYLIDQGVSKLTLVTHLGRPEGAFDAKYVLEPVAKRLGELLGASEATKIDMGYQITDKINMLENIRFDARETSDNESEREAYAQELAKGYDLYVNDAFADCHRKHASLYELAKLLPSSAGFLVQKEFEMLSKLMSSPESPFVCVLGGAKVDTKIGVIKNLLNKVDQFVVGGKIANAFLAAKGLDMKKSSPKEEELVLAKEILSLASDKIILPEDYTWFEDEVYDIGEATAQKYSEIIYKAKTVFWNGPLGYIEGDEKYLSGSKKIAEAMAEASAITIISGGETVSVAQKVGVADKVSYLSTGGGVTLEFLAGIELPGLEVLGFYK
jgi:3-phosphoglycerate kinase